MIPTSRIRSSRSSLANGGGPFLANGGGHQRHCLAGLCQYTAIIGCLSRPLWLSPAWNSFQASFLNANKLRKFTPFLHYAGHRYSYRYPDCVNGRIILLGDMYAFGLLGAFSLTCLGLDIVR